MPDADRFSVLASLLGNGRSTAFLIQHRGEQVFSWGDVSRKSGIASVRKSLIGLLYGIYAQEGAIELDMTLSDIGIDDRDPLTSEERHATVRDLLKARSGVYHPSVYDTNRGRPSRGSHAPGSFWFYNNWDFNALGTIFQVQTGDGLFDAFADRVARPLGMQDFAVSDCRFQHGPESDHPVYKMRLSARDLLRIGQLCLQRGRWNGQSVVPEDWIDESTRAHTDLGGGRGYGYLWWTAGAHAFGDAVRADVPLYYASGFGGQYIIILPQREIVIVHSAADVDHGINHAQMGNLLTVALGEMDG